jgi:DNA-binding Xre family transcriptional regulator
MLKVNDLMAEMARKSINKKDLAVALGIQRATLDRKLSGESEFNRSEIENIIEILEIPEEIAMAIFFAKEVE